MDIKRIHDIVKREIKEEATEFNLLSEYGVSKECLEKDDNEKCYDPNSSESKFSPTHFWENTNINNLAAGIEIEPNFSHELSIGYGTRLEQNTKEKLEQTFPMNFRKNMEKILL
ncbi:hypothetical protein JTB14_009888 [Gonioctena quinquepunctata]|nr:hypothetical protein JTB14_009888 [Gonioctena quinquepunctata]